MHERPSRARGRPLRERLGDCTDWAKRSDSIASHASYLIQSYQNAKLQSRICSCKFAKGPGESSSPERYTVLSDWKGYSTPPEPPKKRSHRVCFIVHRLASSKSHTELTIGRFTASLK